jgi:hypothetical protein
MKNLRILALGLLFALDSSSRVQFVGSLSLSFEENRGQGPADAPFLARGQGYNIVLTANGNHLVLRHAGRDVSVNTRLVDANPKPAIRGEQKQTGKVHYFRGDVSVTDIPTYARVRYDRVYPGIDLVYYGNQQQLEYDFVVKPGADPSRIAFRFDGVDDVSIDDQGNLVLRAENSQIVQRKPAVYQRFRNSRKEVEGAYRLLAANTVAFDVGPYDRNATLVIDPILSYSTFLGGSNGDDDARAVTTDAAGNLYVTGSTTSTNFQTVFALQPAAGSQDPPLGISDAFVTKLNPAGTALVFSTYFGGSNDDDPNAIAVDSNGNVVITGMTSSTDFPTSLGAVRRTCNMGPAGCLDAFVTSLNASGSFLLFSTYFGGTGDDEARDVTFDSLGSVYITGRTDSPDFPATGGAYSLDPESGGFVTKLSPGGNVLYSTYFRTIFGPADPRGIAVDTSGNAYITGGIAIPGSSTGLDVFFTILNAAGTGILNTQTIRGAKDDIGKAIALDSAGNIYVAGETTSINLPTTSTAPQPVFGGGPAFRTTDAGATWSVSRTGMNRTSLFALAIDPVTPSTLYAGADDEVIGGLFKSTNSGDTWTSASSGIFDARIHALAVDPAAPGTVYAGSRTLGVYKSTNGGSTWAGTTLNNVFVTALAIDPGVTATIYAGTDANGIYKSTNGGTSWFSINTGLVAAPVRSIVVDPNANTTVYAATSSGIYKSVNGGASWVASSSGLLDPNINVIVADPRTPNLLFAGSNSLGIFRSTNGGGLWVAANGGLTSSSSGIAVSALTFVSASGTFYAAAGVSNAMQVYKSSNGTSWTATNLASTRVNAFAVDRTGSGSVYAATAGGSDAFIAKWNTSGSLVYTTYLGGYRDDAANAIAIDLSGGVYIAGSTSSMNFPIVNALQSAFRGGSGVVTDAFAAKVEASGLELGFSTYLGGSSDDFAKGIAVDSSNTAYVVGATASADFPTAVALNAAPLGLLDAFIVKMGEGSAISYAVPVRGGFSAASQGVRTSTALGYARIQQTSSGSFPSGLAIFGLRQNNVLVSEAAVPASTLISTGRIYAEVGNNVNTGIAIANPNPTATTVTFYFTDLNGQNFAGGITIIPANGQIAKFLNQDPFSGGASLSGSFTFSASQSVAVIALRGFNNERGEFLTTTLPVADLGVAPSPDPIEVLFPHFADGGGWTTQFLLVNTTDSSMSGSIRFGGLSQGYSIAPRSAAKIVTSGTAEATLTGSARVIPASGSGTPAGVAVFSYRNAGVIVSEAGVPAFRPSTAFRTYAESSGISGQVGSIRTGIAIANPSNVSIPVTLELTTITGVTTGLTNTFILPGNGQDARFIEEIPGFAGVPNPFQGVLRVSTSAASGVSLAGLRGRYNERGDFLITTMPPTDESAIVSTSDQFFPHFADGGGYTTQFILFNGSGSQSSSGLIRFLSQTGQVLSVSVR